MVAPFGDAEELVAHGVDGTPIAVFAGGAGPGTPVLLVHGTGSDHTTWRALAPLLAGGRRVYAMDRRGRGGSGDGAAYAARREAEDVAAVAEAVAAADAGPVAVLGHSLGGRFALAAALLTGAIGRVVAYEGAPRAGGASDDASERLLASLSADLATGDRDAVLERFMRAVVSLSDDDLARFRASDLWAVRVRAAPLIVRELDAALHDASIGLEALAAVRVPVLQVRGTVSPARLREGVLALDRRLPDGRVTVIEGAGHNAHHTHATELAAAAGAFLDAARSPASGPRGLPSAHD